MYSHKWVISRQIGQKYLYNVNIDGQNVRIVSERLNYKATIAYYKNKGYNKVFITCLGKTI